MITERFFAERFPKSLFPAEMPRYPNCWFGLRADLPLRREYKHAVVMLTEILQDDLGCVDDFRKFLPRFSLERPDPNEGCDLQARRAGLQGWESPQRSHEHQVHLRVYASAAAAAGGGLLKLGEEDFFLVPLSLHYEVSTESPLHPYVDECPYCGLTGAYALDIDRDSNDYCVFVHDPLGLECFVDGTVRGERVVERDKGALRRAADLDRRFGLEILRFDRVHETCRKLALLLLRPWADRVGASRAP